MTSMCVCSPKSFSTSGLRRNWNSSSQTGLAVFFFTLVFLLPFGAVLINNFTYGSGVLTEREKKQSVSQSIGRLVREAGSL